MDGISAGKIIQQMVDEKSKQKDCNNNIKLTFQRNCNV